MGILSMAKITSSASANRSSGTVTKLLISISSLDRAAARPETAFATALTNNKDGFTTLLAVVAPNLLVKPATILFNKVTIKNATQAVQMFGPAQHGVAKSCRR